jgi:hypothetical protein
MSGIAQTRGLSGNRSGAHFTSAADTTILGDPAVVNERAALTVLIETSKRRNARASIVHANVIPSALAAELILSALIRVHAAIEHIVALGRRRAVQISTASVLNKTILARTARCDGALALSVVDVAGVIGCTSATLDSLSTIIHVGTALTTQAINSRVANAISGLVLGGRACGPSTRATTVNILASVPNGAALAGEAVARDEGGTLTLSGVARGSERAETAVNHTTASIVIGIAALELEICASARSASGGGGGGGGEVALSIALSKIRGIERCGSEGVAIDCEVRNEPAQN